jgi:hypothetical protein
MIAGAGDSLSAWRLTRPTTGEEGVEATRIVDTIQRAAASS